MMRLRVVVAIAAGAASLAGCSNGQPSVGGATPAPSAATSADALTMMMVAFEGQPSRMEIKALIDPAMEATGTPITEENYSRAGSSLVTLRKKNGTKEMSIMKCMPSRVGDPRIAERGYETSFGTVAAVCSVDILQGRYRA